MSNSTESPLLRLPGEVRKMIWENVLGNMIIHVRRKSTNIRGVWKLKWSSVICPAPISMSQAYEAARQQQGEGHRARQPFLLAGGPQYVQSWEDIEEQHIRCDDMCEEAFDRAEAGASPYMGAESPSISLLSVCYQISMETKPILYSTNVFSFQNPPTLFKFLKMLRPYEKQFLFNVELWIPYWHEGCNLVITAEKLKLPLPLRTLDISIEWACMERIFDPTQDLQKSLWAQEFECLLERSIPTLKKVRVTAVNKRYSDDEGDSDDEDRDWQDTMDWLTILGQDYLL